MVFIIYIQSFWHYWMSNKTIILAMTGASGAIYGLRLLEELLKSNCEVYVVISDAAKIVLNAELDFPAVVSAQDIQKELSSRFDNSNKLQVLDTIDWFSAPASGSTNIDAMVVCPCSMGTLSAIATGSSDSLLERAADVVLKENRQLVLLVREMPFSAIHLENMLKLARLGVSIMPASPGFYHKPGTVNDLVDFVLARVLKQLAISNDLLQPWGNN